MRISDWSSDVCSSDLRWRPRGARRRGGMWAYDALVGLSLFHLGFPPCPEGVDGIGLFEDLRARIGENMHACRNGEAAGAVRNGKRRDPVADAHIERQREGLAGRCSPG